MDPGWWQYVDEQFGVDLCYCAGVEYGVIVWVLDCIKWDLALSIFLGSELWEFCGKKKVLVTWKWSTETFLFFSQKESSFSTFLQADGSADLYQYQNVSVHMFQYILILCFARPYASIHELQLNLQILHVFLHILPLFSWFWTEFLWFHIKFSHSF